MEEGAASEGSGAGAGKEEHDKELSDGENDVGKDEEISNGGSGAGKDYDKNLVYTLVTETGEIPLSKIDEVQAGNSVRVTVKGTGAYNASGNSQLSAVYRITPYSFDKAKIKIDPQICTGKAITLDESCVSVQVGQENLIYGVDYTLVDYQNNISKGSAKVTVVGKGNYGGSKTVSFRITAKNMIWFWKIFQGKK